uniref:Uncharacterized protein n=1 Tax=Emiliania huxleyi TaxID=2903 RepID=A0A7S3T1X5_EMIHU
MASRIELPLRLVVLPGGRVHLSLRLPPASSGRAFLEWEVQQLVAHKPPGLMHAELLPDGPRMVLDADGEAVEGPLCGPPYQVLLRIQRPRSGVYWSEGGLVVRLLCGEGYPASPPEVRFEALLHHFFLDDLGGLPDLFYEVMQDLAEADAEERAASLSHLVGSLPGGEGGEGGVEAAGAAGGEGLAVEHSHAAGSSGGVAGGTRYSLRGTLHMLHFLLQAPLHPCDGCQQRFDYFASLHRDRAAAIAQYQPLRRHPSLFGTAARWRREWLSADARAALESRGGGGGLRSHLVEVSPEVFAFPLLREECCAMLVEEVDGSARLSRVPEIPLKRRADLTPPGGQLPRLRAQGGPAQLDEPVRPRAQRGRDGGAVRLAPRDGAAADRTGVLPARRRRPRPAPLLRRPVRRRQGPRARHAHG